MPLEDPLFCPTFATQEDLEYYLSLNLTIRGILISNFVTIPKYTIYLQIMPTLSFYVAFVIINNLRIHVA